MSQPQRASRYVAHALLIAVLGIVGMIGDQLNRRTNELVAADVDREDQAMNAAGYR